MSLLRFFLWQILSFFQCNLEVTSHMLQISQALNRFRHFFLEQLNLQLYSQAGNLLQYSKWISTCKLFTDIVTDVFPWLKEPSYSKVMWLRATVILRGNWSGVGGGETRRGREKSGAIYRFTAAVGEGFENKYPPRDYDKMSQTPPCRLGKRESLA